MKKLFLLFALAAAFAACNKSDSDTNKPVSSAFAGTFDGTYLVTSVQTPDPKSATLVVTDNPDGSLHLVLSADAQSAALTATINGQKMIFTDQPLFGKTVTGYGEMPVSNQLLLHFTESNSGAVSELYSAEFNGNR